MRFQDRGEFIYGALRIGGLKPADKGNIYVGNEDESQSQIFTPSNDMRMINWNDAGFQPQVGPNYSVNLVDWRIGSTKVEETLSEEGLSLKYDDVEFGKLRFVSCEIRLSLPGAHVIRRCDSVDTIFFPDLECKEKPWYGIRVMDSDSESAWFFNGKGQSVFRMSPTTLGKVNVVGTHEGSLMLKPKKPE